MMVIVISSKLVFALLRASFPPELERSRFLLEEIGDKVSSGTPERASSIVSMHMGAFAVVGVKPVKPVSTNRSCAS